MPTTGMRFTSVTIMAASAAVLLMACENAPPAPSRMTVADSARVRIVTYDGTPEPTMRFSLAEEPSMRHGDGDYLFQMVSQGALDTEGRAVVSDMRNQELVRIAADGSFDTLLARGGRGPGEVAQVISVDVRADGSVLVGDRANGKLMVFEDDAPPQSVSTATQPQVSRWMRVAGVDETGAPLLVTSAYTPDFEEPWLQGHMARLDMSTVSADTVARYDMAARRPSGGSMNPFGHFGRVTVSGHSFVSGRSDVPELVWRRPDGTVHQILRWEPEPIYPTEADWDEFVTNLWDDMRRANPGASSADIERIIAQQLERFELRTDEPYPLFADVRGDDEDRVWVGVFDHRTMRGVPAYDVIAPDGTWLGRVDLPAGFHVLDVRDGRVLGVLRDEMEIESVATYELRTEELGG